MRRLEEFEMRNEVCDWLKITHPEVKCKIHEDIPAMTISAVTAFHPECTIEFDTDLPYTIHKDDAGKITVVMKEYEHDMACNSYIGKCRVENYLSGAPF